MLRFILRRFLILIPTLFLISLLSFFIIQLPPGDYLTTMTMQLQEQGQAGSEEELEGLRVKYGLDKPFFVQYAKWITGVVQGDFGQSFAYGKPVSELI